MIIYRVIDTSEVDEGIMEKYQHKSLEAKWRAKWEESKIYKVDLAKAAKPFYNLMMFPLPIG